MNPPQSKDTWFTPAERQKIIETSLKFLSKSPFFAALQQKYQQSNTAHSLEKIMHKYAMEFITHDFNRANGKDEFLTYVKSYQTMGMHEAIEKKRNAAPRQQQQQAPVKQVAMPATGAVTAPPAPQQQQQAPKPTPQARVLAELQKREKNLIGIISVFSKKKTDSEMQTHNATKEQIEEKRRKYETLLSRWRGGLELLKKDLTQWTQQDMDVAMQTIRDVDNCLKQHQKQQVSVQQQAASVVQSGGNIPPQQAPGSTAPPFRSQYPVAPQAQRNAGTPASVTAPVQQQQPRADMPIKVEAPPPPSVASTTTPSASQSSAPKPTSQLTVASTPAVPPPSGIPTSNVTPAPTPSNRVPSRATATKKTIITLFRSMESYGYTDRMSDLLTSVQESRKNPEDGLFSDLGTESSGFRKRKRRRIYVEEEEDVAVDMDSFAMDFLPDTKHDTNDDSAPTTTLDLSNIRKNSFYSRPMQFRDYSNVVTGPNPMAALNPPAPAASSANPAAADTTPKKQTLVLATQFKLFNIYARRYGLRELVDPATGDTYFEYLHSHSEKNTRRLKIYMNFSPNCSITYGFSQSLRFVECLRLPNPSGLGSIWKEQEIYLNHMTPPEFMSVYRSISHAVDVLRLRLSNDVSGLLSDVQNYDLDSLELDSAVSSGDLTQDKNASEVASANGLGLQTPSHSLAVELRTYHFGNRYTRPLVECRTVLQRTTPLPTLVIDLDFSSADDDTLQSFPVLSHRFMNASSILGMNGVFVRARMLFEKGLGQMQGRHNALFLVREWLRILQEVMDEE